MSGSIASGGGDPVGALQPVALIELKGARSSKATATPPAAFPARDSLLPGNPSAGFCSAASGGARAPSA
ncbi:MAG: hypothetical protein LBQ12_13295 [Deltaproteobacteria bacterium]|nr:hypothetical protein [Deltaproteobacteria bacterium]